MPWFPIGSASPEEWVTPPELPRIPTQRTMVAEKTFDNAVFELERPAPIHDEPALPADDLAG